MKKHDTCRIWGLKHLKWHAPTVLLKMAVTMKGGDMPQLEQLEAVIAFLANAKTIITAIIVVLEILKLII